MERLVRVAVPRVACFAMMDLALPDGRLDRVAYRHIDESARRIWSGPNPSYQRSRAWRRCPTCCKQETPC